jgi:broad specificity phosphatase PhoE
VNFSQLGRLIRGRSWPVIVARHAQSIKALRQIHGGPGMALTEAGIDQLEKISEEFVQLKLQNPLVLSSKALQIADTAKILASRLSASYLEDKRLAGIDLGQAAGLSDSSWSLYPWGERLVRWSEGSVPVSDLRIPGMESAPVFACRIASALSDDIVAHEGAVVWIASRSTCILMHRLEDQGYDLNFDRYFGTEVQHLRPLKLRGC